MTKGRDDVAERMSDLFALIRTRRQSGLLSVERYEGGRFEEGEIRFLKGQPVDAHLQDLIGQGALSQLLTWRQVYFAFSPDVAKEEPPSLSSTPTSIPSHVQPSRTPTTGLPQPTHSSSYDQRPQKIVNEQNVMSLSLTRAQRSLYMLVDGRRTIADLARFTNKDVQEVNRLLSELQTRGFISL